MVASAGGTVMLLHIDVQNAQAVRTDGTVINVDEIDLPILHATMLNIPQSRLAFVLGLSEQALSDRIEVLRERLGSDWGALADGRLTMFPGAPPRSGCAWEDRHCAALLQRALQLRQEDEPFLTVADGATFTLGETIELVAKVRARLRQAMLGPGDRIALDAGPRLETYLLTVAALASGVVVVRLGENLGSDTLRGMVRTTPAPVTFTARRSVLEDLLQGTEIIDLPDERGAVGRRPYAVWLDETVEVAEVDRRPLQVSPADPALIGFTSGSTDLPKAVMIPHEAVFRQAEATQALLRFSRDDVFFSATDVTSNTSTFVVFTLPVLSGGRLILPSAAARRSPLAFAQECDAYGATCIMVVPSCLRTLNEMAALSSAPTLTTVRHAISSTAPLDHGNAERFCATYGTRVSDLLGAREIGTLIHADGEQGEVIGHGGGVPVQTMVRLLDDEGAPVARGEVGQIWVHSDVQMTGYVPAMEGDDIRTPGGNLPVGERPIWSTSGDLCRLTEDGRIEVVGRKRDVIKAPDGSIVFPAQVEAVLLDHDAVVEACVFAAADAQGVENVAAAVILRVADDQDSLIRTLQLAVRARLGPFMTPRVVTVMQNFPRVGRGKPDRIALRRQLECQGT